MPSTEIAKEQVSPPSGAEGKSQTVLPGREIAIRLALCSTLGFSLGFGVGLIAGGPLGAVAVGFAAGLAGLVIGIIQAVGKSEDATSIPGEQANPGERNPRPLARLEKKMDIR